jgi:predicted component of type VI protein secretion system
MELKLKVTIGTNAGQEIKIPGPKYFIGRAEDCQLRPRSDLISRHHCVLIVEDKVVVIRDFGSKNGTYVNGERVGSERELQNGDLLKVGPLEFEVKLTESAAKKRPKVHSIEEAAERAASTDFDMDSDVSEWLSDSAQAADTQEINRRDTEEVVIKPGATPAPSVYVPPPVEAEPAVAAAGRGTVDGSKLPGKLPAPPAAKDSFSAAAEMLRKMRKR